MNTTDTKEALLNRKLEIMIIDNDPVTCTVQKFRVQSRFPQPVQVFEDAREALNFMVKAVDTDFLVLLDIDMPSMDGWEFLSEWQKTTSESAIRVIMLSCSISGIDKERSQTYPEVADYFEKPLYNSHLEAMEEVISSFHSISG